MSDQLKALRIRLKSGEYNGADIMSAWLAIDQLTAAHERIKELESQIADTERRVAEDMYQIFLNLLGEKQ
jgi:hypothetical protein